jgi:hypothetical protein
VTDRTTALSRGIPSEDVSNLLICYPFCQAKKNTHMMERRDDHPGVSSQDIVDTKCIQHIVDMSARCIQHIVDIGHTHLNLGGELCPVQLGLITKTPNFAEQQ